MTKRIRLVGSVLGAIGAASLLALLTGAPASAPTAGSSPSAEARDRPALPAPEPWTEVAWEPPVADPFGPADVLRRVDALTGDDRILVAWGRTPMPGRNQFNDMGAIFVSRDAVTWQTVAIEHGVNALSASSIVDVAIGPRGLLAVGNVCCDPEQPAVWRSADGLAWERLDVADEIDAARWPSSVVAVADGWLLLGSGDPEVGSEILFSADGSSWERVLRADGTDGGPGIASVALGPAGLIAVGTAEGAGGSYDGAIWRSHDGHVWERTAIDDPSLVGEGEARLHTVVGHARGLLATGILGTEEQRRQCEQLGLLASIDDAPPREPMDATSCVTGDEQLWASRDGERWERMAPQVGLGDRPIEFRVVTAGGPGLMLLGEATGQASPDTMLFGSGDGLAWSPLGTAQPMLADVAIGLVARGQEIIAVTQHSDGERSTLRVWRGRAG